MGTPSLKECPAVGSVAPVVRARTQVVYGNRNWVPMYIYGTTPSFLQVRDWTDMDRGRSLHRARCPQLQQVCLVGQTIVSELFGGESPVGKEIRVQNVAFKVIGVLQTKGANMMGMDQDDILLAPWTTIKYRVVGYLSVNSQPEQCDCCDQHAGQYAQPNLPEHPAESLSGSVGHRAGGRAATGPVCQRGSDPGRRAVWRPDSFRHPADTASCCGRGTTSASGDPDDFNIRDMTEITKTMSSTTALMTKLLMCVAMISLVVGGVGIMNIMLVSVTERTREIGLRMAVGAEPGDILRQFLIEAVVLCLLGGTMGIVVGRCSSYIVASVLHWPTAASMGAIVAAVAVSASVGVIFGFYPAWKASRLDPIEALHYE